MPSISLASGIVEVLEETGVPGRLTTSSLR